MRISLAAGDVPSEEESPYETQDLACRALLALPLRLSRARRANTHLIGHIADHPQPTTIDCNANCSNNSYSSSRDFVLVSFTPLTTNEAHVRYILADIQLGNVAGYYRANVTEEETAEALRRWDAGVRVVNSEQFERRIVNGRWYIVYAGTERPVNGLDIGLSSDPKR